MTKIYCADSTCKFNGDDMVCQKEQIVLGWMGVATVNQRMQNYNKCKGYEEIDEYPEMKAFFEKKAQGGHYDPD